MNLHQCEKMAQEIGFDKAKFVALFPAGPIVCQWLDAYMGILKIDKDGLREGFLFTPQLDEMFPNLYCSAPYVEDENIMRYAQKARDNAVYKAVRQVREQSRPAESLERQVMINRLWRPI